MRLIDADKLSEKTRTVVLQNGAAFDCVDIVDIIEAPSIAARPAAHPEGRAALAEVERMIAEMEEAKKKEEAHEHISKV